MAFQRTNNVPAAAQQARSLRPEGAPDNEDAYGVDEEAPEPAEPVSDEDDMATDRLVRATKPKGKAKSKGK